ncbi:hypothetical protein ACFQ07_11460 [Actinomadura adrarensis]|uniref:Uncharacterized protein n=1 Tax=Actinomadura adrarensis TaxID=1819600 RepID=A0ABW3CEZ1_9ACTN
MRPPRCFLCGLTHWDLDGGEGIDASFTLVHFGLNAEEQALAEARDREGWVGHPENVEWFCGEHVAQAKAKEHLHWREALTQLRNPAR